MAVSSPLAFHLLLQLLIYIALHFKFGLPNDKNADYDESQCHYVPQMDPSRDEELKHLLPEYMSEELTFPRPQVDKFYARVVKALTEKPM